MGLTSAESDPPTRIPDRPKPTQASNRIPCQGLASGKQKFWEWHTANSKDIKPKQTNTEPAITTLAHRGSHDYDPQPY